MLAATFLCVQSCWTFNKWHKVCPSSCCLQSLQMSLHQLLGTFSICHVNWRNMQFWNLSDAEDDIHSPSSDVHVNNQGLKLKPAQKYLEVVIVNTGAGSIHQKHLHQTVPSLEWLTDPTVAVLQTDLICFRSLFILLPTNRKEIWIFSFCGG